MSTHDDPYQGRHPRDRAIEAEDPMLLTAERAPGDPLAMLDGLIEEYAGLGWDGPHIQRLFDSPFFQGTWGLRQRLGPELIGSRIDAVLARRGVARFCTEWNMEVLRASACAPDTCAPPGGSHA
ncbi:MAG TPA: hypothetical protein VFY71_04960 [Planctomycetota bacterium]|nr:hypothetical protein [Planctomycetota bacterium]